MSQAQKDRPWLIRTYAGHSTANLKCALSCELGQGSDGPVRGLRPVDTNGYDSDHTLARGEVGKVGVPVCHLGDMRTLFDEILWNK